MQDRNSFFLAIFVVAVIISCGAGLKQCEDINDCEQHGGVMLKQANGFPVCVEMRRVK